jgi:sulfatase maturation enzyme AslB (radical SAM superfamily)
MWIGKLWPRGRAWRNGLSSAGIEDNFCNQWSGGLGFLNRGHRGSEVSIDPHGNVFPCCVKTKIPLGNLLEQPLEAILDSKRGNPVYEAISAGEPERMGHAHGWSTAQFLAKSKAVTPDGRPYENLCVGCDAFHDEVLAAPTLVQLG